MRNEQYALASTSHKHTMYVCIIIIFLCKLKENEYLCYYEPNLNKSLSLTYSWSSGAMY
jgi:hypothetical protein